MENTLEAALKQWKEREQRYEKLFSPSVLKSREFLREKLRHFDGLRAGVMAGTIKEDRLAMRALELERGRLAKQAYPNLIARLVNWVISGFRLEREMVNIKKQTEDNSERIRAAMEKAGLGKYYNDVQKQIRQGTNEFSLPVSYHINEHERIDLQLNFKKDDFGMYAFDNYKAALQNDLVKGRPREHTFSVDDTALSTSQAYNLLVGRAIYDKGNWQQLDFNDKDAGGNFRMKHFPESYGFEIEKALASLPLKEDKSMLLTALKNGEQCTVTIISGDKETNCHIAAAPQQKELGIYNDAGQRTNLAELKAKETYRKSNVVRMPPKQETELKQKGKSVKL